MTSKQEQIDSLKRQGLDLVQSNRLKEAKALYTSAINVSPEDADAWYMLSTINGKLGNIDEAEYCCRNVLALQPDHSEAYVNLGHVFSYHGKYDEAVKHYQSALRLKPASPNAYYNIGNIFNEQGRQDEAIESYKQALHFAPDHVDALNNLGTVYLERGKFDEAIACYLKVLEINPQYGITLDNLGKAYRYSGQLEKYFEVYRKAVEVTPDPTKVRTAFIEIIGDIISYEYNPWLDEELKKCYSISGVDYKPMALVTAQLLKHKHEIQRPEQYNNDAIQAMIEKIASDDLFIMLIEKTINVDGEMEILLTKVRRFLLFKNSQEDNISRKEFRVISALAHQCLNNEYIFAIDDKEELQITALKSKLEQFAPVLEPPTNNYEYDLFIFGMYERLISLSCRDYLGGIPLNAWSEMSRPFLKEALFDPLEEENIKREILSIGDIKDQTSQLVQSQYEENPYPRWLTIPECKKRNVKQILKGLFPHFTLPAFLDETILDEPIRILVAGCGTGQHPIRSAMTYNNVEILAVDISKSSLAYAIRMARNYDVKNIQFMQGDILELSKLDKRFHIIECVGVLHHMNDPLKGWSVLSSLLVEDGLMSIGLYSEIARRNIVAAREIIGKERIIPDKNNIRNFRMRILKREMGDIVYGICNSPDFYSTSGCRDLLFHFKEHRFTLPQLKKSMNNLDLKFVGFNFNFADAKVTNLYRDKFPEDKDMTNLILWDQFENMRPNTFAKMYNFWCQKISRSEDPVN